MYTSEKLEKLKAVPQWVSLACGGCGMGLLMLFALGYWAESIIAVVFTVAGWSAGYIEAKSWYARLEEEQPPMKTRTPLLDGQLAAPGFFPTAKLATCRQT